MSTSPTNSVSVVENVPIVQQRPLLIRSLSNTSNKDTQKLCTHCRSSRNKEFFVEFIPLNPFMKGSLHELQQLISEKLENKAGCHLFTKPTMAERHSMQEDSLERQWWDGLFAKSEMSPFMHMWSVLLGFEKLFCSETGKKSCNCLELCFSAMSQSMKENYTCNMVQLRTGLTTIHETGLVWSPCSLAFALELSLSWAWLLIEQLQQQNGADQATGNKEAVPSNLAVESFGVLENWVDFILTGKLGPRATSSGKTEPESSFREESERSKPSEDGPATPVPNRFTIVLVSDRTEPPAVDAATDGNWQMLATAWQRVVRHRLESEPDRTVQFSLADVGKEDSAGIDSLVEKLLSLCH